jgi:Zn-dependent peptidase ImmA (M78 family)/DNA-binding XRE family transcriptional regulator
LNEERFNADMLRLGRDAREATQSDLARSTGFTQALVSKLENGLITTPSEEVVAKISEVLHFPREFFFQKERQVGFPPFHYRKRQRLGSKALSHIGAIINIRRQHVTKLLRSYEHASLKPIPQIDLDESGLTPERIAERLRAYWMIPRGPVPNVVELVEEAGGIVLLCRFGTDLLDGISFRSEGLPPLFFMNRDVPGDRFRFSLVHELGHMVMHTVPADDGKMEAEAHRFAAAFLMPAADIRPYLSTVKLSNLSRVKAFWKVSIKSLIKRAHDLKLITDHYYKVLNIQYNKSFREGEPVQIPLEKPALLGRMVRYHLDVLGYSVVELAHLLCVNEEDMKRTYFERPRLHVVASK